MAKHSSIYECDNDSQCPGTLDGCQAVANQLENSRHAARSAIDELRRWRDDNDPGMVQHSIDMAIRILERG